MLSKLRIQWLLLLVAGLWFLAVASVGAQAQASSPEQKIETAMQQLLTTLRADPERARAEPAFVLQTIEQEIVPLLDIEGMSRLVLARHWRDATPEQQQRFTRAFYDTLLHSYGVRLADYLDHEVIMVPRRSRQDERMAVVATEVVVGRGQPNLMINYRLRPVDGEWKVFDVEAEGLSFVGNFRTSFNEVINQSGLDALITRLEAGDRELLEQGMDALLESGG